MYILWIYLGLTRGVVLALWLAGMTPFEAIDHAMSLISTGGYLTSDASLAHWPQPAIHWTAVIVMILGSLPFTLYVATLRGHRSASIKDQQVRGFISFLVITWLVVGTWLSFSSDYNWWDSVRIVAINVTSVVTTTALHWVTTHCGAVLPFCFVLPDGCWGMFRLYSWWPQNLSFSGGRNPAVEQPKTTYPSDSKEVRR